MKIIIMNVPGHGHVNPTLPIVTELVARGHAVLYYNTADFGPAIRATGADFRAYPANGITPAAIARAVSSHLVKMTLLLFEESLALTAFMRDEITREAPDLLIFDSICLWGMQAARLSGLPMVASITTFVLEGVKLPNFWRDRWHMVMGALRHMPSLLLARNALIKRYGRASLPPKNIFPCAGDLNIVYTISELQPPTPIIDATFRFVGPTIAARSQDAIMHLPEGRIIYISLGTIHTVNHNFFAACFEAFADAPGCFVLAAGEYAASLTPPLNCPPNFIIAPHVPQLQLLQRADLFITHAGINSLHESLYFGVPMVMVPQQMEQAMNARVAEMHGVGMILGEHPPYGQQVSAAMLRAAADIVLTEPRYRDAAQRMQTFLQATDGTAQAVEAILKFAATREREK